MSGIPDEGGRRTDERCSPLAAGPSYDGTAFVKHGAPIPAGRDRTVRRHAIIAQLTTLGVPYPRFPISRKQAGWLPAHSLRRIGSVCLPFSSARETVRKQAADAIVKKLGADGIVVKEVMLRDILLPPEYAKGLEGLLMREQENERLSVEVEIKQKEVRTAELEAEADKARKVKEAEAEAAVVVLQAKAQADAMQHTVPLKQKQIEQSRLEAEARKEATVKNAEAQAKVIDSKAELEKRNLLSEADGNHIRVIAAADAERMKSEAAVLKNNPLLIQKIIAERLSDKVQIMMVPADGKFFFANDILKSTPMPLGTRPVEPDDDSH